MFWKAPTYVLEHQLSLLFYVVPDTTILLPDPIAPLEPTNPHPTLPTAIICSLLRQTQQSRIGVNMPTFGSVTIQRLAALIAIGLFISPTSSLPTYPNTTTPSACSLNSTNMTASTVAMAPLCQTFYPTEYRVMNSRYPTYDESPLHSNKNFFMLLRQRNDTFQVATQIQWSGLAAQIPPNTTCTLQFQLPTADMQTTAGTEPIFDVYQVEREAGVAATWNTYDPWTNVTNGTTSSVFGRVNGTAAAQSDQWNQTGGLYEVGVTDCNDTLTWQMGMAFNGGEEVNYWDFVGVAPPASPIQGFRLLNGC